MKYVMFAKTTKGVTKRVPIIFPDCLIHADVAEAMAPWLKGFKPVNAGETHARVISTTGKSDTLGLKAREEDTDVINQYDYLHGIDSSISDMVGLSDPTEVERDRALAALGSIQDKLTKLADLLGTLDKPSKP